MLWKRLNIIYLLPLAVLAVMYWTDPDKGVSTGIWALRLGSAILALTLAHIARKAVLDYPEADWRKLFKKAAETPEGAGLALIASAIIFYALTALFAGQVRAQDVRTYVPARCIEMLPVWRAELAGQWPDHPTPAYMPALSEHESCISLKHSRCCSPTSRLKTQREEGAGVGQITRAYRSDGTLRFDALQEMKDRHPVLADWNWNNVYQRPDLQARAVVLQNRDCYQRMRRVVADPLRAVEFCDAGYNGGETGVQAERRACGLKPGCDPQQWFKHVELTCLKSKAALYGQRSACDINRHHVDDVTRVREPKYAALL